MKLKCPECGTEIEVEEDIEDMEVVSCPCCASELEYSAHHDCLMTCEITGEDWGE